MSDFVINDQIRIPWSELTFTYSRSRGPGGQNVNKVNSKASLRWNVTATDAISEHLKYRLNKRWGTRITTTGDLMLHSDTHRDQRANSDACLQKLREILLDISRPRKPRIATKPSRGAIERRIESKRQQSQRKSTRRQSRRIDPE